MRKTKTLDLFVTDTDYDKDQETIGAASTLAPGLVVQAEPSAIAALKAASAALSLKTGIVVRFVSATVTTDFITVRRVLEDSFIVENAVDLPAAANFQCVLVRQWSERPLALQTRFQHIVAVELMAYALVGLSSLTLWEDQAASNAPPNIDFVALEIKELPGRVLSTNRFMQNALAILPTHMGAYHPSSWTEAKDAMVFVPSCMMKTEYEQPILAVNTITPKLIDRRGDAVMAARFHMWLRLTVLDQ
jgi:hypothetical protein